MSGFVWCDLMTRDVEAAKRFYADLLGWAYETFKPGELDYEMICAGGTTWGGIMALPDEQVPPNWLPYAAVADLDAAVARAGAAGGHVQVPPMPIPEVGRFAVLIDPQGAAVALFEPQAGGGNTRPDPVPSGGIAWTELLTTDLAAALTFYETVTGWGSQGMDMGPMGTYTLFTVDGVDVAGAMTLPAEASAMGAPPHWMTYIAVDDVAATAARAGELGATALYEPMTIPGVGTLAGFADPQGAIFSVLQPER